MRARIVNYARWAAFLLLAVVTVYGAYRFLTGDWSMVIGFWRDNLEIVPLLVGFSLVDVVLEGLAWMWVYHRFDIRAFDRGGAATFVAGRAGLLLPAQLGRLIRPDAMMKLKRAPLADCLKAEAIVFVLDACAVVALLAALFVYRLIPAASPIAALAVILVCVFMGNKIARVLTHTRLNMPTRFWWAWPTLFIIGLDMVGWIAHGLALHVVVADMPGDMTLWDSLVCRSRLRGAGCEYRVARGNRCDRGIHRRFSQIEKRADGISGRRHCGVPSHHILDVDSDRLGCARCRQPARFATCQRRERSRALGTGGDSVTKPYPFTLIKERLAARQEKALDFAVGRRRLPLPVEIGDWVRASPDLAMQAATRTEVEQFAEAAVALLMREYDVEISTDNILPAPGGRAAMSTFVACALEPGNSVFVTEPGYPAFARLATHRHASIYEVPLDGEAAFVPDFSDALAAASGKPRVIALNYPNNPTGATLTDETADAVRRAAGTATIVFNDATYGPLAYSHDPVSLLGDGVLDDADITRVELHSFAKLFPLGPIVLSFLAGSTDIMQEISTYSEFAWSPPSKLQLSATTMCLRDAGRFRELRRFFPAQLETLQTVLTRLGFRPYTTTAGVYALSAVPSSIAGRAVSSAEEAALVLMDRFDLAVVPWDTAEQHYLRFSSLYRPEDIARLEGLGNDLQLR